ncbi:MAG: FadR/GntR family transcriptional regulator [Solirubrobacteraceae bacterium]
MTLHPIQHGSLPDKVFEQLTSEIVCRRYAPGDRLPSERALTQVFDVNRHVVREAIKRLEQIGLVRTNQGGRTRALDFRLTAGLDLLSLLAEHADAIEPQPALFAATLELRAGIGVDLVRLCTERADDDVRHDLVIIAGQLAVVGGGARIMPIDQRFWQRILDGAGNLAYQLAFNSLIRATHAIRDVSLPWLERELRRSDHRRPLAAAIAARDVHAAVQAAHAALAVPPEAVALLASAASPQQSNLDRSVSA